MGGMIGGLIGGGGDATGIDSSVMWQEDPRMYVDDAETDLLRLSGGVALQKKRTFATNGTTPPHSYFEGSAPNFLYVQKKRRFSKKGGTHRNIEFTYAGFSAAVLLGGESTAFHVKKRLKVNLNINGVRYPLDFSGSDTGTLPIGGIVKGVATGLSAPAGTYFMEEITWIFPTKLTGTASSPNTGAIFEDNTLSGLNVNDYINATLFITGGTSSGQKRQITGNNGNGVFTLASALTTDATSTYSIRCAEIVTDMFEGIADGDHVYYSDTDVDGFAQMPQGAIYKPTIVDGVITGLTKVSGGSGWTHGGLPRGEAVDVLQNQATIAKKICNGVQSGGQLSSINSLDGTPPSGWKWSPRTEIRFKSSGGMSNLHSGVWGLHAASKITSEQDGKATGLLICGDSTADPTTDTGEIEAKSIAADYTKGKYEWAIDGDVGIMNIAIAGEASGSLVYPHYPLTHALVSDTPTDVFLSEGSNDLSFGFTASDVRTRLENHRDYWRSLGCKVFAATIQPRVTGTYATIGGQSPATPGASAFGAGGHAEVLSGWLRDGTINMDYPCVDIREVFGDATTTWAWQVFEGQITDDGLHASYGLSRLGGVAYCVSRIRSYFYPLINS